MSVSDGFTGADREHSLDSSASPERRDRLRDPGKAEFMNPGGSVKDRAAKWIVLDAEKRGLLPPVERWSRARQAIPASVWRTSAMHAATNASS